MNYNLLILVLILGVSFTSVYADVYRGNNFERTYLGNNTYFGTFGLPERILDSNNSFNSPYVKTENINSITVKSGTGSFTYDKNSCTISFFDNPNLTQSSNSIKSDTYLFYGAVLGSSNFFPLSSINNASCQTQVIEDGQNIEIWGTKSVSNVGSVTIKWIKLADKPLKVQIEPTNNNPSWTNHKLGIKQTILVPDNIVLGGINYHLPNYNGTHLDRNWIQNHSDGLMNYAKLLIGNTNYDFGLGWQYLDSIDVFYNGQSKLILNYFNNDIKILPGQTLVIDPSYSSNNPNEDGTVSDTDNDDNCESSGAGSYAKQGTTDMVSGTYPVANTNDCSRAYVEFDTTIIPDYAVITDTDLVFQETGQVNMAAKTCSFYSLENKPSSSSAATVFTDAGSGTLFVTGSTSCQTVTTNITVDLGSNADTNLQSHLVDNFFGVGIKHDTETATTDSRFNLATEEDAGATPKPTLNVTWQNPDPVEYQVSITNSTNGDITTIQGTVSLLSGYNANLTKISYYIDGVLYNLNSTGQNGTSASSYPIIINFGPLFSQQTTDSIYNHTIVATVQDYTFDTTSNSSQSLTIREYDPDYFTADDPTQGTVNYTINNNYLQVNRDKNATSFNVECQLFTQAQAFLNQMDEGDWLNETGIYYYRESVYGYYYGQCFNDGELFTFSIPQNYNNTLVPGLVIFDQLGGFFGAPSIILVILSILSLGTGRNFPIILVIAAAVTGMLIALDLLVLDAGLVVALIVMAGIGIFGIRKFY